MKATKKIVGAACALVAAVALSAGSTFAWFVQNSSVQANDMKIQTSTAKNLAIKTESSAAFGTSITLASKGSTEVQPVTAAVVKDSAPTVSLSDATTTHTMASGESIGFYTISSTNKPTDPNNATTGVTTMTTAVGAWSTHSSKFTADTAKTNWIFDDMWLLYTDSSAGETAKNINLEIVVTAASESDINKALHIGFVKDSKNWVSYDLSDNTTFTYNSSAKTFTATLSSFVSLKAGTAMQVDMYVWYEGEDSECTTSNSATVQLDIDMTYSY